MQLKQYYNTCIQQLGFDVDPGQQHVIAALTDLQQELAMPRPEKASIVKLLDTITSKQNTNSIKGRYIWGGVGRGKTWIMDLFFHAAPSNNKLRLHFHHFMQKIHGDLTDIRGVRDPLKVVAKKWAEKYQLICLDEFNVSDITDAMLLYGLLEALFNQGVVLVVTSNLHPDDLYRNGLQRERFVPAIKLIKEHTQVVNLKGREDYRFRGDTNDKVYYSPIEDNTTTLLKDKFQQLSKKSARYNQQIIINQRSIDVVATDDVVIWLEFKSICGTTRSTQDYIVLARQYHTFIVSNVVQLNDYEDDKARRFIHLIDELYDNKIRLIISSQYLPSQLYIGKRLTFEFDRAISRLQEMQSKEYLLRSQAAREIEYDKNITI